MPRSGRRAGAGRKAGAATRVTREVADRAAAANLTPLEYMLSVMQDEAQPQHVRLSAASMAAPFIHPRLTAVDARMNGALTVDVLSEEEKERRAKEQDRRALEKSPDRSVCRGPRASAAADHPRSRCAPPPRPPRRWRRCWNGAVWPPRGAGRRRCKAAGSSSNRIGSWRRSSWSSTSS